MHFILYFSNALNNNAIAWLESQIAEKQKDLNSTVSWFKDERLAGWMLDLAHHYGWRGEDALWDYLEPRFDESWQYDRSWARSLLQVAEMFRSLLGAVSRKRLEQMAAVLKSTSKEELQTVLEEKYGIKKNISQSLEVEACEKLLTTLKGEPITVKLVRLFVEENADLERKNRRCGSLRTNAEKKLQELKLEYHELEMQIATMENSKAGLNDQQRTIDAETQTLRANIERLSVENRNLAVEVQTLFTQSDELVEANNQLKKDNKELKSVVDQIRLRLARDTKMLLQYEDSDEIRRAFMRVI